MVAASEQVGPETLQRRGMARQGWIDAYINGPAKVTYTLVAFQHEMQNNRNAVEMGGGWDHCS